MQKKKTNDNNPEFPTSNNIQGGKSNKSIMRLMNCYGARTLRGNQGEAGFTAEFTHCLCWRWLSGITQSPSSYWRQTSSSGKYLILIKQPILAHWTEEERVMSLLRHKKTVSPYAAPQKNTKTIFGSHSIYSSCYTSESCHQHFLDINQCQDQREEEEERLRRQSALKSNKI